MRRLHKASVHSAQRNRRGSMYIAVLLTASIVSLIGLSALTIHGLQRRAHESNLDVVDARLYAQSAVRLGMLQIENDPDWRYSKSSGAWATDIPLGNGTLSLEGTDTTDGNLADDPTDAIQLTGIGKKGQAIQRMSVTLIPENRAFSALDSTAFAAGGISLANAQLNGSGILSTNGAIDSDYQAGNSIVQLPAEAGGSINDYGTISFHAGATANVPARTWPADDGVFDYYKTHGTWIPLADIVTAPVPPVPDPIVPANLLNNPGLENGLSPWFVWQNQAKLALDTDTHSGNHSAKVSHRTAAWSGLNYEITSFVQPGIAYDVSAWVKVPSDNVEMRFTYFVKTASQDRVYVTGTTMPVGSQWTEIKQTIVPEWTGTLTAVVVYIETVSSVADFLVDDVSLTNPQQMTLPSGDNVIENGNFEAATYSPWTGSGCSVSQSATAFTGVKSLVTTNRDQLTDTVTQELTSRLVNQATWHTEGWIRQIDNAATVRLELEIHDDAHYYEPLIVPLTPWRTAPANTFAKCYGQTTVTWSGTLQSARLRVAHLNDASSNFHLDDVAMVMVNPPPPPPHTIYRQVLSPQYNPFGGGATNSDGVYVIDCQNQNIFFQDCRIVGTLVLLNAGSESSIRSGSLNWEPARDNFPALLVDGNFSIQMTTAGLSESRLDANFNPPAAPYPYANGSADNDTQDIHLSEINGLLYATGDLETAGALNLNGSLMTEGQLTIRGTHTWHGTSVFRQNPPPGFSGPEEIRVLLKSARKDLTAP